MACCGRGGKKPTQRNIPIVAPVVPRAIPVARVVQPPAKYDRWLAPPGSVNAPNRFCQKCGWSNKKTKFIDPVTKATVERTSCTNRQCPDYK